MDAEPSSRNPAFSEQEAFEQLRRSEERYRVTLASIGDGVIATDLHGRITFMNPVAETLTGWSQQESLGCPLERVFCIINEVTRQTVQNPVAEVLQSGRVVLLSNHTLLTSRQGQEWPVSDSAAPICDSQGRIAGVVLVFHEETKQRAADLAAKKLAAIVEGSEDAIISKDLRGTITSWNQGAERLFGYQAHEMIGQSIAILFPPERWNEEQLILARLQAGERVEHFETVRINKGGEHLDVSLTISPIRNVHGNIIGASKIARNITEQRRAAQALLEAQEKLQAQAHELERRVHERTAQLQTALEELESFSYSISHDLRAPLRAMQQYSQLLLDDNGSTISLESKGYLSRIIASANRLDVLIHDVLTYSQVLRAPTQLERVSLEPLIVAILQNHPGLQPPNAIIQVETPLIPVQGQPSFLTQCLSNLLFNAVKFVPKGRVPQVRLWTEQRESMVRLLVQDNGIGIPREDQSRIFAIFERVHAQKQYEGTGIGLAIVRKAVERMGGRLGLDSEVDQGAPSGLTSLPATAPPLSTHGDHGRLRSPQLRASI